SAVMTAFHGLPVHSLNLGDNVEYPNFVRWMKRNIWWDLAIAPLQDNPFTRCKSDIKFLDYSALGIAGVYSRVQPYEQTVRHLETGYLTDNSADAWVEALDQLLSNDSLRHSLADRAREYVLSNRTLKYCAQNWRDAILS